MGDAGPANETRLAYFAHVRDDATYCGGLVVVSTDGDPLEFLYTEPVTLGRVAQRLLGSRADGYILERVLLPALLEQAGPGLRLVCFDEPALLQRRVRAPVPCVVFAPHDTNHRAPSWTAETVRASGAAPETCWISEQGSPARALLEQAAADMAPAQLREPFGQLRAALADVRQP